MTQSKKQFFWWTTIRISFSRPHSGWNRPVTRLNPPVARLRQKTSWKVSNPMWRKMPVILVTGVAAETGLEFDSTTGEERSWIKADRVIAKPIRFEQLESEIARLVTG